MNQRHSSVKTSNSVNKNQKLSSEANRSALRPSSGVRKASQVGPAAQKRNVKGVLNKFQLETKPLVKTLSTSSNVFRQSASPKLVQPFSTSRNLEFKPSLKPLTGKLESKPSLKPPTGKIESKPGLKPFAVNLESKPSLRPPTGKLESKLSLKPSTTGRFETKLSLKSPSRFSQIRLGSKQQRVFLPQEEIQQLTSKFEALSATIVHLATSDSPISVRSLETLLTQEVNSCLGSAINGAKFAEGFVRETRRLLYGLHCKFEEGRFSTQLIKGLQGAQQPFLRTDSATTACYRDRYLKELVMNTLQEVCKMTGEGKDVSAVNKQRAGGVLRDLVRAEAGMEPEVFQRAEKGIQQLQQSVSFNQQEVQSAFREIDQLISEQQRRQEHVVVPKMEREVAKDNEIPAVSVDQDSSCKVLTKENTALVNENNCSLKDSHLQNRSEKTKNCLGVVDKHQPLESLKNNNITLDSDPTQSIRLQIDQIVKEEMSRAQEKTQDILNRITDGSLKYSRDGSLDSLSASEVCEDTDDELDAEETLLFLEALKADATHKLVQKCIISSNCSLLEASVDDFYEDVEDKENIAFDSKSISVGTVLKNTDECCNKDEIVELALEKEFTWIEAEVRNYKLYHGNSMPTIAEETNYDEGFDESECDENTLRGVKSVWWAEENREAQEIVNQINNTINAFTRPVKDTEDVPVSNKKNDIPPDGYVKGLKNSNMSDNDFTVKEMAHILKNISKKVYHLPLCKEKSGAYFCDTYSPLTNSQQTDLMNVLSLLENTLGGSLSPDSESKTGYQLDDEKHFTATKEKLSCTFNMISDTLGRAPTDLQTQPISAVSPPASLIKALALLAATGIFRDCFIAGILEVHKSKKDVNLLNNNLEERVGKSLGSCDENGLGKLCIKPGKDLEVVKPVSLDTQQSSVEIFPENMSINHLNKVNLAFKRFEKKMKNCDDVSRNTSNYEHYLGLSVAVMTVKNVSDMFIFLSAVLNDIPDRMKAKKITSLNPPATLLTALDVLYNAEDGGYFTEVQKSTSFNSLTVQSVSNLFLTLSKAFEGLPDRVKHSNVLDMDPPKSLVKAINLLTSLPLNCSVLDGKCEEELERMIIGDCRTEESQEYFYDALDTSTHH